MPATLIAPFSARTDASIMGGPAEFALLRGRLDRFLSAYLESQRTEILSASQAPFAGLYDDLKEFVCRPGKRLRPMLFLLAYRIFSGSRAMKVAAEADQLAIAASLELLHTFILIHDDIVDHSDIRRGLPALHRRIERHLPMSAARRDAARNLAMILGDVLFALAQKCLIEVAEGVEPAVRLRLGTRLLGCLVETGFGEAADILHGTSGVSKVSLGEIEQMYLLKTTRYTIECPLVLAAMLAGAGSREIAQLARVARPAGLAFQIQNDLQGFSRFEFIDSEVPPDMLQGKKTLLIRTAFSLLNENDRALLQRCFTGGVATQGMVFKVRELIAKSGAIERLGAMTEDLLAEADEAARDSVFGSAAGEALADLIGLVGKKF